MHSGPQLAQQALAHPQPVSKAVAVLIGCLISADTGRSSCALAHAMGQCWRICVLVVVVTDAGSDLGSAGALPTSAESRSAALDKHKQMYAKRRTEAVTGGAYTSTYVQFSCFCG